MKNFFIKVIVNILYKFIKLSGYRIMLPTRIDEEKINIFCLNHTSTMDVIYISVILNKEKNILPLLIVSDISHHPVMKHLNFLKKIFNAVGVVRKKDQKIYFNRYGKHRDSSEFMKILINKIKKNKNIILLPEGRKCQIRPGEFRFRKIFEIINHHRLSSQKELIFYTGILDHRHKVFEIKDVHNISRNMTYEDCRYLLYESIYRRAKKYNTYFSNIIDLMNDACIKVIALDLEGVLLKGDYKRLIIEELNRMGVYRYYFGLKSSVNRFYRLILNIHNRDEFLTGVYENQARIHIYKEIYDLLTEFEENNKEVWLITRMPELFIKSLVDDLKIDYVVAPKIKNEKEMLFNDEYIYNQMTDRLDKMKIDKCSLYYLTSGKIYTALRSRIQNIICINPKGKMQEMNKHLNTSTTCI